MNIRRRLEMMQELKSIKEETETCNCGCENCQCNPGEEKTEENETILSDEEIEEIIKTEYGDKNVHEKRYIIKALKMYGTRFSYHNTEFIYNDTQNKYNKQLIITCAIHGDFTTTGYLFFRDGCPSCIAEDDKKFDEKFRCFVYKDFPNTRKYLKDQFIAGNIKDMGKIGVILKDDFLSLASETRDDLDLFDFSDVPDIIFNKSDRFNIKYISPRDNTIKIWKTDISHFIDRAQIPSELQHIDIWRIRYSKNNYEEKVKLELNKKYPYMDFSDFKYKTMKSPITGICKIHGEVVNYHTVDSLLRDGSDYICSECAKENKHKISEAGGYARKDTKEFIEQCEKLYGVGRYNYDSTVYIKCDSLVRIFDNINQEFFEVYPKNFLRGSGNPYNHMSFGETLVYNSLKKIKNEFLFDLKFKYEVSIIGEIEGRDSDLVKIDFVCSYNSRNIWIEYNGEQHYELVPFKRYEESELIQKFKNQLKRDKNVREYCLKKNIELIEIPYTYRDINSVYNILYKILVENLDKNDVIIIPEIEQV